MSTSARDSARRGSARDDRAAVVGPAEEDAGRSSWSTAEDSGPEESDGPTVTYRWWLRLQIILTAAGGVATVVGMVGREDFFTGMGLGLFVGALSLRLGRRACADHPEGRWG